MISFSVLTVHCLCMTPRGTIWRIAPIFVIWETSRQSETCFSPCLGFLKIGNMGKRWILRGPCVYVSFFFVEITTFFFAQEIEQKHMFFVLAGKTLNKTVGSKICVNEWSPSIQKILYTKDGGPTRIYTASTTRQKSWRFPSKTALFRTDPYTVFK